jgi:hypothetical protein
MSSSAFWHVDRWGRPRYLWALRAHRRSAAMLVSLLVSCGFPRPADVGPADGSVAGSASDCRIDQDCTDSTQPVCVFGRCLSPADACKETGGRIVFLSTRGGTVEIYVAYANGSAPTRLASEIIADGNVAPSPGGASFAFVRQSPAGNSIAMVDAFGQKVQNIAATFGQSSYVEWSPDGTRLLLGDRSTQQTTSATVYIARRDGQE